MNQPDSQEVSQWAIQAMDGIWVVDGIGEEANRAVMLARIDKAINLATAEQQKEIASLKDTCDKWFEAFCRHQQEIQQLTALLEQMPHRLVPGPLSGEGRPFWLAVNLKDHNDPDCPRCQYERTKCPSKTSAS